MGISHVGQASGHFGEAGLAGFLKRLMPDGSFLGLAFTRGPLKHKTKTGNLHPFGTFSTSSIAQEILFDDFVLSGWDRHVQTSDLVASYNTPGTTLCNSFGYISQHL